MELESKLCEKEAILADLTAQLDVVKHDSQVRDAVTCYQWRAACWK